MTEPGRKDGESKTLRAVLVWEVQIGAETFEKRLKTLDFSCPELERELRSAALVGIEILGKPEDRHE